MHYICFTYNIKIENMRHIYPNTKVYNIDGCIALETTLRKEYNGKYYYVNIACRYLINERRDVVTALNEFHAYVYRGLFLYEIDLDLRKNNGEPYYELAETQETEAERLKEWY